MSKETRRLRRKAYDEWIANSISGGNLPLKGSEVSANNISVHFNYVETFSSYIKYFMITKYPDYIDPNFLGELRLRVMRKGVKMNYFITGQPHYIAWDSPEMRSKVDIWKRFTDDVGDGLGAFDYREGKQVYEQKKRLIDSTMYLNRSELDYRRTVCKVTIIIQIVCDKDKDSIVSCNTAVKDMIKQAKIYGIKIKEIRKNMTDWLRFISVFSLKESKNTTGSLIKKVLTDDIVACMSGFKQGRIGDRGVPLGVDIKRKESVLYVFKDDPNKVENWLISASSGGGKSYFVKSVLMWLLAAGFTVTVTDYEGDEYTSLVNEIGASNPDDVKLVSMGKGSAVYVDPMEIPDLTGDKEVDDDLKETSISYVVNMFRIIVHGVKGDLTRWEQSVISTAISRVYDEHGVTDDHSTWKNSTGVRIREVYENISLMVEQKEFADDASDNVKHKAAVEICEACLPYFDEDGAKSSAFKQPMSLNSLHSAKLIVFSFGAKGAVASTTDKTLLALKQLSVANISTQISNYSKYVRHCFNVKVWEEYQRYGEVEGSAEIIGNSMTGGRKRGDINFIITNDLANILDDNNPINKQLRQNISTFCIGKIRSTDVVKDFCEKFQCHEVRNELLRIAKAGNSKKASKYKYAFCIMLDDGKKAIVRSELPKKLAESNLFSTGVKITENSTVTSDDNNSFFEIKL